ncbi:hypothetical protein MPSEU_000170600 [Mayamaea pseudoterrestris]|nr:hypothetical protein MPSEU_000170600 [Mayamaea pseudoterrestris]
MEYKQLQDDDDDDLLEDDYFLEAILNDSDIDTIVEEAEPDPDNDQHHQHAVEPAPNEQQRFVQQQQQRNVQVIDLSVSGDEDDDDNNQQQQQEHVQVIDISASDDEEDEDDDDNQLQQQEQEHVQVIDLSASDDEDDDESDTFRVSNNDNQLQQQEQEHVQVIDLSASDDEDDDENQQQQQPNLQGQHVQLFDLSASDDEDDAENQQQQQQQQISKVNDLPVCDDGGDDDQQQQLQQLDEMIDMFQRIELTSDDDEVEDKGEEDAAGDLDIVDALANIFQGLTVSSPVKNGFEVQGDGRVDTQRAEENEPNAGIALEGCTSDDNFDSDELSDEEASKAALLDAGFASSNPFASRNGQCVDREDDYQLPTLIMREPSQTPLGSGSSADSTLKVPSQPATTSFVVNHVATQAARTALLEKELLGNDKDVDSLKDCGSDSDYVEISSDDEGDDKQESARQSSLRKRPVQSSKRLPATTKSQRVSLDAFVGRLKTRTDNTTAKTAGERQNRKEQSGKMNNDGKQKVMHSNARLFKATKEIPQVSAGSSARPTALKTTRPGEPSGKDSKLPYRAPRAMEQSATSDVSISVNSIAVKSLQSLSSLSADSQSVEIDPLEVYLDHGNFLSREMLDDLASIYPCLERLPGFFVVISDGSPPLPHHYLTYLAALPLGPRIICQRAMEIFTSILRYRQEWTVPLQFFVNAQPEFGLQRIAEQICGKWFPELSPLPVTGPSVVNKLYFLCLVVGDVPARLDLRLELERRYWKVEHVSSDVEEIKQRCCGVAPDFIYAFAGFDYQTLSTVVAWAKTESPHLQLALESQIAAINNLIRDKRDDWKRFGLPLHMVCLKAVVGKFTLWVNSPALCQRLLTMNEEGVFGDHSDLIYYTTHCVVRYINARCDELVSRAPPTLRCFDADDTENAEPPLGIAQVVMRDDEEWADFSEAAWNDYQVTLLKRYIFDDDDIYLSLKDDKVLQDLHVMRKSVLWDDIRFPIDVVVLVLAEFSTSREPFDRDELIKRAAAIRDGSLCGPCDHHWVPQLGMWVRKMFDEYHVGRVTNIESFVNVNGERENLCQVTYDDGDNEEYEGSELLRLCQPCNRMQWNMNGRLRRAVELFCGRGRVADQLIQAGFDRVISVDNDRFSQATHRINVHTLTYQYIENELGDVPDAIFGSPPCTTFTCLACGKHRSPKNGLYEITDDARRANYDLAKLMEIMVMAQQRNPDVQLMIENPDAAMDKCPLMTLAKYMLGLETVKVNYCAFGRDEMKPTHLWTNNGELAQKLSAYTCKNVNCPYNRQTEVNHPGSVQNDKDAAHCVIPEPLAAVIARGMLASVELNKY